MFESVDHVVSQLEKQGWRFAVKIAYQNKTSVINWIVFTKHCEAGERYSYRTEKYLPPIVILK